MQNEYTFAFERLKILVSDPESSLEKRCEEFARLVKLYENTGQKDYEKSPYFSCLIAFLPYVQNSKLEWFVRLLDLLYKMLCEGRISFATYIQLISQLFRHRSGIPRKLTSR